MFYNFQEIICRALLEHWFSNFSMHTDYLESWLGSQVVCMLLVHNKSRTSASPFWKLTFYDGVLHMLSHTFMNYFLQSHFICLNAMFYDPKIGKEWLLKRAYLENYNKGV